MQRLMLVFAGRTCSFIKSAQAHIVDGVKEEPQPQNIAYQSHQEEEQVTLVDSTKTTNQIGNHIARQEPLNTTEWRREQNIQKRKK